MSQRWWLVTVISMGAIDGGEIGLQAARRHGASISQVTYVEEDCPVSGR
jgi:hypothetical protein